MRDKTDPADSADESRSGQDHQISGSDKIDAADPPGRDEIDAGKLLDRDEYVWEEERDRKITSLAIFVIGAAAASACCALLVNTIWPETRFTNGENWAVDILTLALVASLSFVMGTSNSGRN